MAFYDLNKEDRERLVEDINRKMADAIANRDAHAIMQYFSDEDTYIQKTAYSAIDKIYKSGKHQLERIIAILEDLFTSEDAKVRQTVINATGELGMIDFETVQPFFEKGLFDAHHSVRNAVIGSIKKMGQKKPEPFLEWAKTYVNHHDKEVRREICHGIELRGRTHPQDILPLLKELQYDKTARVRNTLIHVLGQIAYKKGCLATVVTALRDWENKELVEQALDEIVDVHERYKNFAVLTQQQAIRYIDESYRKT